MKDFNALGMVTNTIFYSLFLFFAIIQAKGLLFDNFAIESSTGFTVLTAFITMFGVVFTFVSWVIYMIFQKNKPASSKNFYGLISIVCLFVAIYSTMLFNLDYFLGLLPQFPDRDLFRKKLLILLFPVIVFIIFNLVNSRRILKEIGRIEKDRSVYNKV